MSYLVAFLFLIFSQTAVYATEPSLDTSLSQAQASEVALQLTPDEKKWLAQHKSIRVAYDGSLPPYSFVNDSGRVDGIAIEIMALLSERLGIEFTIYPNSNWNNLYKAAAKHKVDVVATMVDRPDRSEWFSFTKPYLTKSLVIITREDNAVIDNRNDLVDKKVAVVEGYQYGEQVGKEFPTAKRIQVKTMLDSLKEVNSGRVDAAIIFVGTANYLQAKYQMEHLKIAAFYDRNSANESIAVRKDWPIFVGILQKALDSLTEEKIQEIFAKWIVSGVQPTEQTSEAEKPAETKPVEVTPAPVTPVDVKPVVEQVVPTPVNIEQKPSIAAVQEPNDEASEEVLKITKTQLASLLAGLFLLALIWTRKQKKLRQMSREARVSPIISLPSSENENQAISIGQTPEKPIDDTLMPPNMPSSEYIYYQHDCDGVFSYVSPSVTSLLGYSEADFMAHYRNYLTDNPINRYIDDYIENCIQGQPNKPYEIEIQDVNGQAHWLEVMDTPVYDGQGHCIGVDGVMHDITDRKLKGEPPTVSPSLQAAFELSNPQTMVEYLQSAIQSANKSRKSFALLYLSLDRLRFLDGNLVPPPEAEVLNESGNRLRSTLRDTDIVVQLEANKFALILTEADADKVGLISEKIRKNLQVPYFIGQQSIALDANMSVAVYPRHGTDPEALLSQVRADLNLEEPPKSVETAPVATESNQSDSLQLQQVLVGALDECRISLRSSNLDNTNALHRHSQFSVYYQSRHSLGDYNIMGFEALIRWDHPQLGMVLPADFVPLVNDIGLLDVMTYWIIQQVCFQALVWEKQGILPGLISINLGDLVMKKAIDVSKIINIINEAGAKPEWLTFSIPESEVASDPDLVIPMINQLVAVGLVVSIDNFGSDSSLLNLLKTIPARIIEIDPAFIRHLPKNTNDAEIITYSIAMLHELGKKVIAKEVETEEQLEFLKESGCDMVQGHLLSKPVPAKEAKSLMESFPDVAWYFQQK